MIEMYILCFLIGAASGAIVVYFIKDKYLEKRINYQKAYIEELEAELKNTKNQLWGMKGRQNQIQNQERMEEAISEAMLLIQSGKPIEEVVKEIGAKYPDVAGKLLKKHLFK
jgi:hypothetical protein